MNTSGKKRARRDLPESPDSPLPPSAEERRTESLRKRIDPARKPMHVAIIMDGNGRWARQKGYLRRTEGHQAAIEAVRAAATGAAELGLRALTLFAFSTENWSRPKAEVSFLMRLFESALVEERETLVKNRIRLLHSGHMEDLPEKARRTLQETMALTAENDGLALNLALSYGGRTEILDAVKRFAQDVASGRAHPEALDAARFEQYLYHPELGDPDLLIRTSGEMRISNFLLWQLAYAEIHVTPKMWPDFRRADLFEAIIDFQKRERRFGAIG